MPEPLRILIADDHPIFRRGLCEVLSMAPDLELAGEASDGEQALRLFEQLRPSIVILDVQMPKLTGLQAARAILQQDSSAKLILLTMHEDEDLLNEAIAIGIQSYVLKENAIEDLVCAIRAVAAGKIFISGSLAGLLLRRRQKSDSLRREKPGLECLTVTERRVLQLIADDKTTKEIASELGSAVRTIDTHRQNISQKLGLNGTHSLLKFAYQNRSFF